MATTKPRITISVTPEQYALLDRLSSLKGGAKSTIVTDVLEAAMPALERTADLLQALEQARRGDYLEDFVANLNKAEATLAPLIAAALDQLEMPLETSPSPRSCNTGVTTSSDTSSEGPSRAKRGRRNG